MYFSSLIRKKLLTLSITSTYHGIFHQAIYSLASLKRKKLLSTTPLKLALNSFIIETIYLRRIDGSESADGAAREVEVAELSEIESFKSQLPNNSFFEFKESNVSYSEKPAVGHEKHRYEL